MADFINTVDLIGDDELSDQILMKTVTEYRDSVLTKVRQYVFLGCEKLTLFDTLKLSSIGIAAFRYCSALTTVILRNTEAVCALGWASWAPTFGDTPIASGAGYIYVPSALLESYKTDSNWTNYANQFRALEDYTVDGTITGELDESKI